MIDINVSIPRELFLQIRRRDNVASQQAMNFVLTKAVEKFRQNLEAQDHIAKGKLRDNVRIRKVSQTHYRLVFVYYSWFMHVGVKKFNTLPPVSKIRQWLIDKGIEPYTTKGDWRRRYKSAAFGIAKHLKKHGMKPNRIFDPLITYINSPEFVTDFETKYKEVSK